MTARPKQILLVTGMSGAGKSTVLKTLEDLGWALDPIWDHFQPGIACGMLPRDEALAVEHVLMWRNIRRILAATNVSFDDILHQNNWLTVSMQHYVPVTRVRSRLFGRGDALTGEQAVEEGIAGTQAAGLMAAQYGSMVKRMHAGRGAQSGVYAAFLAEADYTGIVTLFESEYGGFCTTYSGTSAGSGERFNRDALTQGLGQDFETLRTSLKFYASAASTHTALDALSQIRSRRPFDADAVEKITVHACHGVVTHVGWKYEPRGLTSAQMNLPFCMATLLLEGDVFIEQFNAAAVNDPRRMALAGKVDVIEEPAITAKGRASRYEVLVQVRLKDGTQLQETAYAARGSAKQFATEAEVVAKFEKLASRVLPLAQVAELRDAVLNLEKQPALSRLAQLLILH